MRMFRIHRASEVSRMLWLSLFILFISTGTRAAGGSPAFLALQDTTHQMNTHQHENTGRDATEPNKTRQDKTKTDSKVQQQEKMQHDKMQQGQMGTMREDMERMHKNMQAMRMTGDVDHDFASMMIEHHKGAINMSQKELDRGNNRQVKAIAREVIRDQKKDIQQLQSFVKKEKTRKVSADRPVHGDMTGSAGNRMMKPMDDMRQKMQGMPMSSQPDKNYVTMMIMHHQAAIDMSQEYLDNGKNEKLKGLAQKTIQTNKDQIARLEKLQGSGQNNGEQNNKDQNDDNQQNWKTNGEKDQGSKIDK